MGMAAHGVACAVAAVTAEAVRQRCVSNHQAPSSRHCCRELYDRTGGSHSATGAAAQADCWWEAAAAEVCRLPDCAFAAN